jgi:large subunit ribosomal protein L35
MGKIKTHSATAKRFKLTKSGLVKHSGQNRRHKLGHKSPKRKRQLRKGGYLSDAIAPIVRNLLPRA